MTYIFLYLVIGLIVAVVTRVVSKQKIALWRYIRAMIIWPVALLMVIGDWEI